MSKLRLNIGAGDTQIPGFISVDIKTGFDVSKPLPYADGSVEEIYCSHTLEHIHHSKTPHVLYEFARILKPGGRIRLAVPDFGWLHKAFSQGILSEADYNAWTYGSMDESEDRHLAFFSAARLETLLRSVGIEKIEKFEPEYKDCSRVPASLNLVGHKRKITIKENPTVCMILSTPRFGPVDFYLGIIETARTLGWNFLSWGGTEWGKGLTGAAEHALEGANCLTFGSAMETLVSRGKPDYVMVLDYDSVFSPDDCKELLRLMQENPDYGALYPVEAHRHCDGPLGWDSNLVYNEADEISQVGTGHFGCTIIRREVFESLPKPWFLALPNHQTGEWRESLDADIGFWLLMATQGWRVGQANNVHIGHMEFCIKWLSPKGVLWQPIQAWRKAGKPEKAKFDAAYWNMLAKNIKPGQYPPVASQVVSFPDDSIPPAPKPSGALTAANFVLKNNGMLPISDDTTARPYPVGSPELSMPSTNDVEALEAMNRLAMHEGIIPPNESIVGEGIMAECERLAARREYANGKA